MTVGAIYNWFENKSMLFGAALEFALQDQQSTNNKFLTRDNVQAATGFQSNHWLMLIAALAPRQGADSTPIGALGGTRTPNPLIRSQMLYPLSYERW